VLFVFLYEPNTTHQHIITPQGISVTDCMVKAAALAMRAVPDVNAQWMGTFVRQYDQVGRRYERV
jgi:pyruvate/2-oxoglutarate dehydrogenase complex dihydrolipoamide acyltransferase (E2) component